MKSGLKGGGGSENEQKRMIKCDKKLKGRGGSSKSDITLHPKRYGKSGNFLTNLRILMDKTAEFKVCFDIRVSRYWNPA